MQFFLPSFLFIISSVLATSQSVIIYHEGLLQYYACRVSLDKTVFYFEKFPRDLAFIPPDGGFCNKNRQQALGSMAHCLRNFPRDKGIDAFLSVCQQHLTMRDIDAAFNNATRYLVNVSSLPEFNSSREFFLPVQVDRELLDTTYKATLGRFHNDNRGNFYGIILVAYWIFLICFAGIARIITAAAPSMVHSFNGKVTNVFRKYVTLAPLGRKKVVVHGRALKVLEFAIPTRSEVLYLIVWFAMVVAFSSSDYDHDMPNVYWPLKDQELSRKVANRTGRIILYLIPQIILFAGRNNVFQWISGWRFARFNTIHRWMARSTLLLMITHAVCMTIYIHKAKFPNANSRPYIRMGYVAIVAAGIMCFHSLRRLRKNYYELFVLTHNILGTIFIASVWVHVRKQGLDQFMYAATAFWVFDKLSRLVRIAWFGLRSADVQLFSEEILKVTVTRPSSWKPYPLSFAYIYFLKPNCFWQSHPFTVVDYELEKGKLAFYIKVKGGLSNSLMRYLNSWPEQKASLKCAIEGPYGVKNSLKAYKSISYFSSGTGIAGFYYSAVQLATKNADQRLKIYWVVHHLISIQWFYEELKALDGKNIDVVIYITQDYPFSEMLTEKAGSSGEASDSKSAVSGEVQELRSTKCGTKFDQLRKSLHFVDFRPGRPNLAEVVRTDIQESSGSIAFLACGRDEFVDSARSSVISNLENGKRVDFYDCMEMW